MVEPNPVDFGAVLRTAARSEVLELVNASAFPLAVRSLDLANGGPAAVPLQETFEINQAVGAQGEILLPDGTSVLTPGARLEVPVSYRAESLQEEDRVRWRLGYCDNPLCETSAVLVARTERRPLRCTPDRVDFGLAVPGRPQVELVRCMNITTDPLLVAAERAPGTADDIILNEGEGDFLVEPGAIIDFALEYAPTQDRPRGDIASGVLWLTPRLGNIQADRIRIPLAGRVGGARLEISPSRVDFGLTAVDTRRSAAINVRNSGLDSLTISNLVGDAADTGAYGVEPAELELDPGETARLIVRFVPPAEGTFESRVAFETNDRAAPSQTIPLTGEAIVLGPCHYELEPPTVSYGVVQISRPQARTATVTNVGPDRCLVGSVQVGAGLEAPAWTSSVGFTLARPAMDPTFVEPGEQLALTVAFNPPAIGSYEAELGFYISSRDVSEPAVRLEGTGAPFTTVACQTSTVTVAGRPVTVSVDAGAFGGTITDIRWSVVSAPQGGVGTQGQWSPNPPRGRTVRFLPRIVGPYILQATATDDAGQTVSCVTQVNAESAGFQVALRWDGAGDVDLHLHNRTRDTAWFDNLHDCHYANRTPLWDFAFGPGQGPNPELDVDNTRADGPENIRITTPRIGRSYTVAVHNFARAAGRTATVDIYCGGRIPEGTFTSRRLVEDGFWKVATVRMLSEGTCRVESINEYTSGADATRRF